MKKLLLSLSTCMTILMGHTSLMAMEMPKLTVSNKSNKPLTLEYRNTKNFDTGNPGKENLKVGEETDIDQRPNDSINSLTITVSNDPSVQPLDIKPEDIVTLAEFPTSTIEIISGPQGTLEYEIITPEKKDRKAKDLEPKSFKKEEAQFSADLPEQKVERISLGGSRKIIQPQSKHDKEGSKIFIEKTEGFTPKIVGNNLQITKIINEAQGVTIAILPSADPLGEKVGYVHSREGMVFISAVWSKPLTLENPISIVRGDAPTLVIIIGNTEFYQIGYDEIVTLREKLGNHIILRVHKDRHISFEADKEARK
ncbi:hypothetical protein H0W26_04100 [Candidatus Dependentiae bacterium]|nr:hypothetical protein [Candidatus Dependentiae bacterium]